MPSRRSYSRRLARLALAARQCGRSQAIRIEKAETQLGGLADTDPRRDGDNSGRTTLAQPEAGAALEEPSPRPGSVELELLGQPSRSAGCAHIDPLSEGLGSSDEDAPGRPFRPRREVEAAVNAIDQVDVDCPRRPPQRLGALRPSLERVGRWITLPEIGLSLNDPKGAKPATDSTDEYVTEDGSSGPIRSRGKAAEDAPLLVGRRHAPAGAIGQAASFGNWLGGRDSNPDSMDQNHVSCRWTTTQ